MSIELRRIRVCAAGEIPPGEGRVVRIGDRPVAVFRSGDALHALDSTCTHMGGPLADGLVADDTVACPLHERRFTLASGTAVGHDCGAVAAYPVELEDGEVFLTVPVMRGPERAGDQPRVRRAPQPQLVARLRSNRTFEATLAAPGFVLGPSCSAATHRVLRPSQASTSGTSRCPLIPETDH